MEIPGPGIESQQRLWPSHSCGNARSLTHCTKPAMPQKQAGSLTHCATVGTSECKLLLNIFLDLYQVNILFFFFILSFCLFVCFSTLSAVPSSWKHDRQIFNDYFERKHCTESQFTPNVHIGKIVSCSPRICSQFWVINFYFWLLLISSFKGLKKIICVTMLPT